MVLSVSRKWKTSVLASGVSLGLLACSGTPSGILPGSSKQATKSLETDSGSVQGQDSADAAKQSTVASFVNEGALFDLAAEDLLTSVGEADRPYMRYVSAVHLANAGATADALATVASGVARLINELSSTTTIKAPAVVAANHNVYRIDLRDYGWDSARWEELTTSYPYLIVPKDSKGLGVLQNETSASVPVLRADWMLYNASRAPLYYRLAGMPDTMTELTAQLKVNLAQDIANHTVMRSGFNNSVDESTNRVIERHPMGTGVFWRSYEFASNTGTRDVLANPLGPASSASALARQSSAQGFIGPLAPVSTGAHAFTEDGGEVIATRPNGLFMFYAFRSSDNTRLDAVPTKPDEVEIIAGYSCMKCHGPGFITKPDMVRPAAAQDPQLASVLDEINALYADPTTFQNQITQDNAAYTAALAPLAAPGGASADPVFAAGSAFVLPLTAAQAAAELGVSSATLQQALASTPALSSVASSLTAGTLTRDAFKTAFPALTAAAPAD